MRRIAVLGAFIGLALGLGGPALAAAPGLKLEAVVSLTRHGVRPPTKAQPMPEGFAADAWPGFPVEPGFLTPHGAKAMTELGRYDRAFLAGRGLVAARGCPKADGVSLWADVDERTVRSAEAWAEGFAPGCGLKVGRDPGKRDPLFSPIAAGLFTVDPEAAANAVRAQAGAGGVEAIQAAQKGALKRLGEVYGCCQAPICLSAAPCKLEDLPTGLEARLNARPALTGALDLASTAAQIVLLEYADGRPMAEVGWGRATAKDMETFGAFHAIEFNLLARNPYIAPRNIGPIARRMLQALQAEHGAAVTVLLGHDTNVASLGGLLDLHWQAPGYATDDPAPGGALGLERLRDAKGRKFVRAYYEAQGIEQVRHLTPLSAKNPPYRRYLPIPGCASGPQGACPLADFAKLVETKLVP